VLLVGAACSAPGSDSTGESSAEIHSKESGGSGCAMSRDQILNSVGGVRREAITRGFTWWDDNVPYSQSATHEGYRTDCSGFVSMCWQAGQPGETTSSFADQNGYHFLDSYDQLIPGDAIDAAGHHVVLFLGWNDDAHSGICVIEQASTASDMQFRVRTTSSLKSGGFKPLRPDNFPDDEALGGAAPVPSSGSGSGTQPTAGGDDDDSTLPTSGPSTDPTDPGPSGPSVPSQPPSFPSFPSFPTTPTTPPSSGGACVPLSTLKACMAAAATSGLQCGTVSDGCGGTINCDNVDGFGCTSDATCTKNKCTPKTAPSNPAPSSTSKPTPAPKTPSNDPDNTSKTQGEPGDVGDTGNGDKSSDPSSLQAPAKQPTASGGCSTAPSGTGDATGSAGLAFAVVALLKRRRRNAQK
jgi:MYXO-CTERM domain-containing protein